MSETSSRPTPAKPNAMLRAVTGRRALRPVHLTLATVLGLFVYSPWIAPEIVQFVVFPLLLVTGLLTWQSSRIRRALASSGNRPAPDDGPGASTSSVALGN